VSDGAAYLRDEEHDCIQVAEGEKESQDEMFHGGEDPSQDGPERTLI
jgi:hypothetical protein